MTIAKKSIALLSLLLLAGCQAAEPDATTSGAPDESAAEEGASASSQESSDVSLTVASWEEVQEMVADHEGQVVVLDLWSTWCIPCIREFPNLVELQRRYPEEVACMSVNTNYDGSPDAPPESHREDVLAFLEEQGATFENVICSVQDIELYEQLDLAAVPAVFVYDKSGELEKRFDNDSGEYGEEGFGYEEHVIPLVEKLIGE